MLKALLVLRVGTTSMGKSNKLYRSDGINNSFISKEICYLRLWQRVGLVKEMKR